MKSLFLELLRPVSSEETLDLNRADLLELKALAWKHNLFMLIYSRLQKYGGAMPEKTQCRAFLSAFKPHYLRGVAIAIRQEESETKIISAFRQRGISALVIKGSAIASDIYDDKHCRISSDIDILVKRDDVFSADSLLTNQGFQRDAVIPLQFYLDRIHHSAYHRADEGIYLEMHWLFGVPYFFNISSEEIWGEISSTGSEDLKLSPELMIIMLLIHHHSHSFRELKILVDILWACHRFEKELRWKNFALRLKKIGLLRTAQISLAQIESLWGGSSKGLTGVRNLVQEISVFRNRPPGKLISFFQMDLSGSNIRPHYKDKLIARFALDSWPVIISSFLKTLFPAPATIKKLYGDKRSWTLPVNYMKFFKWRLKDWTGAPTSGYGPD